MHPILRLKNVSKTFGGIKALNNLSFEINSGEIVGLIGPNGAGKSTMLNAIMNTFKKDSGVVEFNGIDISSHKTFEITDLGITRTFQDSLPLPQITVRENIDLAHFYSNPITLANTFFRRKQLHAEEAANLVRAKLWLKKVGLEAKLNQPANSLSYGQGKLLEMIKVMVSDAKLVLLDEPFSGLFPEVIKIVADLIRELAHSGKTIVLIEHNMQLIEELANHVIVLDAGRKIAEGSFKEVIKNPEVINSYLGH